MCAVKSTRPSSSLRASMSCPCLRCVIGSSFTCTPLAGIVWIGFAKLWDFALKLVESRSITKESYLCGSAAAARNQVNRRRRRCCRCSVFSRRPVKAVPIRARCVLHPCCAGRAPFQTSSWSRVCAVSTVLPLLSIAPLSAGVDHRGCPGKASAPWSTTLPRSTSRAWPCSRACSCPSASTLRPSSR